eukprot:15436915-Alexandrium_andersonii.AAC.1
MREAAAMCDTDTMRSLPFYAGLCSRCQNGLCREIAPGARGLKATPLPQHRPLFDAARAVCGRKSHDHSDHRAAPG